MWHMAMASASDASAPLDAGHDRSAMTILATWSLVAAPKPVTAFLMAIGAYSKTGRPCLAAPSIQTPRACPSMTALLTFFAWKMDSTETPSGECSPITAFSAVDMA